MQTVAHKDVISQKEAEFASSLQRLVSPPLPPLPPQSVPHVMSLAKCLSCNVNPNNIQYSPYTILTPEGKSKRMNWTASGWPIFKKWTIGYDDLHGTAGDLISPVFCPLFPHSPPGHTHVHKHALISTHQSYRTLPYLYDESHHHLAFTVSKRLWNDRMCCLPWNAGEEPTCHICLTRKWKTLRTTKVGVTN